jgi:hypothetical protein
LTIHNASTTIYTKFKRSRARISFHIPRNVLFFLHCDCILPIFKRIRKKIFFLHAFSAKSPIHSSFTIFFDNRLHIQMFIRFCSRISRSQYFLSCNFRQMFLFSNLIFRGVSTITFLHQTWWQTRSQSYLSGFVANQFGFATNFWLTNKTKMCNIYLWGDFVSEFVIKFVGKMWWWKQRTFYRRNSNFPAHAFSFLLHAFSRCTFREMSPSSLTSWLRSAAAAEVTHCFCAVTMCNCHLEWSYGS